MFQQIKCAYHMAMKLNNYQNAVIVIVQYIPQTRSLPYHDGCNLENGRICFVCNNLLVFAQSQYQDDYMSFQSNHPSNINKPVEQAELATECPICRRIVGAAHMCKICNLVVHAIETCFIPDPNTPEGFGQSRICLNCHVNEPPKTVDSSLVDFFAKCSTCGMAGIKWGICIVCRNLIHSTDIYSVPCNEDDRGVPQGRLCKSCARRSDAGQLIETHCMENWKGQAMKFHQKEIRGHFLQKKYSKAILAETKKLAKVPILRTGTDPDLKAVSLNNKKLNLINTCAFDSLFQLFLSVLYDSDKFRERVERLRLGNFFLKMLLDVRQNGVNKGAYVLRAKMLWPISEIRRETAECITIDARMTVGGLCRNLLKEAPCFEEISKCDTCNYQRKKEFVLTSISIESFKQKNYNKAIEREIILPQNRCCSEYTQRNDGCIGKITNKLLILESYLIFEIRLNSEDETLGLIDIPRSLKLSMIPEEYTLRGIAAFVAPDIKEQMSDNERIRHYKGFCFRNRRWTEYDHKMIKCDDNYPVSLHLVLYAK
ncbi:uncharacterized protein LOC107044194 [Diachasma alloeum]|uniref:uncharacterized protein LOC107044194 n=1 Tax=Diachasma alloeum TaxID=454923 RepID=UPI0007383198|nr:uncharacterized protein LOC107044194 [Diachasma alloeum]